MLGRRSHRPLSLAAPDWLALRYLAHANRFSRTPAALARYSDASPALAARLLRRLTRAGLIASVREDAGEPSLVLTAAGQERLPDDPLQAVAAATGAAPDGSEAAALLAQGQPRGESRFGPCAGCHHFVPAADGTEARCRHFGAVLTAEETRQICASHQRETDVLLQEAARRHRARW